MREMHEKAMRQQRFAIGEAEESLIEREVEDALQAPVRTAWLPDWRSRTPCTGCGWTGGYPMTQDFADFLDALNSEGAAYVVIGGMAVMYHLPYRTTRDIDVLIQPTLENAHP